MPVYAEVVTPDRTALAEVSAPAELALGDAQLVLGPRRSLLGAESPDPYVRLAGFAQITGGGSAGGDLSAGVAAAVAGLGCDFAAASMQGRLRPTAELRLVGAARWSVCLSQIGITLALDGRDGIGLAPPIDARRSLWSRRYDETYRRITLAGGEGWIPGSPHRHSVFVAALGHRTTIQTDGMERRNIVELDLDFAMYRYRHVNHQHTLVVELLALASDAIKAGDSNLGGVTYDVLPVRFELATGDVHLAAKGGVGYTGGKTTASSSTQLNGRTVSSWADEIDATGLPELRTFVGSVTAGVAREPCHASVSISRSFYPTFDGNVALENRLSGSATWTRRGAHAAAIALSPFVAHTTTWTRDAGAAGEIDVGASLHASYALSALLAVDAIAEAGRTPYARLDGARLADSFGGQLLVAFTAHVAR